MGSQQPENYAVLVQLLRLLRNHGQLPDDGPRFLTLAAKASPRALYAPGYHYFKGLFARWGHNPREALQEFNLARMDALWGLEATLNMVEVFRRVGSDGRLQTGIPISQGEAICRGY